MGLSPHWDWKTLETEHFRVHFPEPITPIAQLTAQHLERAHALLAPRFEWNPATKTDAVVIDNEDAANGLTSASLRFGMILRVTPPDTWYSTYYYEDWLAELVIHEYTHFLNMDATEGFWSLARILFGDAIRPNSLWNPWALEGFAVVNESQFSKGGRTRGPYFRSILRSALAAGTFNTSSFMTLDKLGGPNPNFPLGETPYLFGSALLQYVADHHGWDTLFKLSRSSAGRMPYFINGNLENTIGKTWYQIWDEWSAETRTQLEQDLATIRTLPVTETTEVPQSSGIAGAAAYSPDGRWMAYDLNGSLNLYDLSKGTDAKPRSLQRRRSGGAIRFSRDSRYLLWSGLERNDQYFLYGDLWAWDLKRERLQRLSTGLRARDPDASSDGRWLTFTQARNSQVALVRAPLSYTSEGEISLGPVELLHHPGPLGRDALPRFTPSGSGIVFTHHPNGESREDILHFSLTDRSIKSWVADGHYNRFPSFNPQGQLYFVSDRSGVDNLYRLDANHQTTAVSNVESALWFPAFNTQGVASASLLTTRGWKLVTFSPRSLAPLPKIARHKVTDKATDKTIGSTAEALSDTPLQKLEAEPKEYSIYPSILPRSWSPLGYFESSSLAGTRTHLGATLAGFDSTLRHEYFGYALHDSFTRSVDWLAFYSNRTLGPSWSFQASQTVSADTFGFPSAPQYLRKFTVGSSLSQPLRATRSTWTPSASFFYQRESLYVPSTSDDAVTKGPHVFWTGLGLGYAAYDAAPLFEGESRAFQSFLGARAYFIRSSSTVYRAFARHQESFKIGPSFLILPSVALSGSTHRSSAVTEANVVLDGSFSTIRLDGDTPTIDEIPIRGYAGRAYFGRFASRGALDLRYPIWSIYRGWGTNPVFLNALTAFVFGEATSLSSEEHGRETLGAYGGGMRLSTQLLVHVPVIFSVEYQKGLNQARGGTGEGLFSVLLGRLPF